MTSPAVSTALRLLSPKPHLLSPKHLFSKHPLFSPNPHYLLSAATISFQPLPSPHLPRAHLAHQDPTLVDPSLLPPPLQSIISLFQSVSDPSAKYRQLLHYATQLPPLDRRHKTDANRVRGCVSQVWVRAFLDPDDPSAVRFEADSDSALTKGLAAVLVIGLSGSKQEEISKVPPEFVHLLGIRQSLTESRNNGFLNMLRLMQQKALQLSELKNKGDSVEEDVSLDATGEDLGVNGIDTNVIESENDGVLAGKVGILDEKEGFRANGISSHVGDSRNDAILEEEDTNFGEREVVDANGAGVPQKETSGRGERIREVLERKLSPVELEVEDISHLHAGHAGVRGSSGGETHFNVRVVSKEFEGKSLVKRHRIVYGLLQEELQSGLHAISIEAKMPSEVQVS